MSITLPDARQLSDEVLQALQLRAIRGCEMGYNQAEVADLLGLARETVWTQGLRTRFLGDLGQYTQEIVVLPPRKQAASGDTLALAVLLRLEQT